MVCVTLWNLLQPAMSAVLTGKLLPCLQDGSLYIINTRQSSYTHTHTLAHTIVGGLYLAG